MITDLIKPIKLLSGHHKETAETGQGCFMNVVAYLNGEAQITDASPCVCVVIKPIAIFLNDFLNDSERHLLIPFIERAMGSVTDEKLELVRRANLVVDFAKKCENEYAAQSAAQYAQSAAQYAALYAAKYAQSAAQYAALYAAKYAQSAAQYAAQYADVRAEIIEAAFHFLNEALPKKTIDDEVVTNRAIKYVELANAN